MRRGQDIAVEFPGLYVVHHNLPGKQASEHAHAEHLLFLPLQGEIHVICEGKRLSCGPGRMIYLPPNTTHSFDSSSLLGERLIALFAPRGWTAASQPSVLMASELVRELLFHLLLHPKTKHARSLVTTLIEVLEETLESGTAEPSDLAHLEGRAKDPRVKAVVAHLGSNFHEPISMDALAKRHGLSTRNLNRLFTVETGMSPKQWLTRLRISRAEELILTGKSVTEAAFAVGYESLSPFIRAFRLQTGQLPSEVHRIGRK